jgi:hypothetical protein
MEFYLGLVLLIGVFGWISVLYINNKIVSSVLAGLFMGVAVMSFLVYNETLGRPKAVTKEFIRSDKKVKVLSHVIQPNVALYVLLQLEGINEPRYYVFPWSEDTQKMAQSLQDGQQGEQEMFMSYPFESSLETRREVHPNPPMMEPPKQIEENPNGRIIEVQ